MGYYIRSLPWKKSKPQWKLQFISYKNDDIKDSRARNPKKEWDVRKSRWRSLGFHSLMTVEEAKVRVRQLNAQRLIKEQEKRIILQERLRHDQLRKSEGFLSEEFVAEFEKRFVRARDSDTLRGLRKKSRAYRIWSATQEMITTLQIEPSDWFYHSQEIYDYFCRKRLSLRYTYVILKMANLWGFFICRKLALPFLPVAMPRGYERARILEAFYEKDNAGISKPSKPLLPEQLVAVKDRLNSANFNWLFLSVWFGLRPKEIDSLHDSSSWKVEVLPAGRKVLWVFQTKIIALPPADRWKPIPILFDEQEFCLRIIEGGNFKRPIRKTMKKHFGFGVTLYAGRKGFSDLMLSKNHSIENISIWMGHSTLDRTWRSYKSRKKFHLNSESGFDKVP